jgi:branched-chain amino acid transport system substrate-binding protein
MRKIFGILIIIVLLGLGILVGNTNEKIKIGIITDLTGLASYWGESTVIGTELALKELKEEGLDIELIYEDYQLDPQKSVLSAQKLIELDNVDGIYAEFNPAAVSVGEYLKDKNILFVYDAAVESPLKHSEYFYKVYIDYREGCKLLAKEFKEEGIEKLGMLKLNWEAGEICLEGIRQIYPEVIVKSYDFGDQDFTVPIIQLNSQGVRAIINIGFEPQILDTLKVFTEKGLDMKLGTTADTITDNVKQLHTNAKIKTFDFSDVSKEFESKLEKEVASIYGAAEGYLFVKLMAKAIIECQEDKYCIGEAMNKSQTENILGFSGFNEKRVANIELKIESNYK